jgi:hypothetical protein
MLLESNKLHQLQDDLESMLWVLLWMCLKFVNHNLSPPVLQRFLDIFDETKPSRNGTGGTSKRSSLLGSEFQGEVKFTSPPLNTLFERLLPVFASRYARRPLDDDLDDAKAVYLELGGEEGASKDKRFRYDPFSFYLRNSRLENSRWIIKIMRALLDSANWPVNDIVKAKEYHSSDGRHAKRTGLDSFHGMISKRIR